VPQGELTIVVDLAWQRLYAYRGGVEIGRAAILYGADDKPTPTGTFKILRRRRITSRTCTARRCRSCCA
jgi:lipoprotein-anchoring transpeptidase ErfK/SrfK